MKRTISFIVVIVVLAAFLLEPAAVSGTARPLDTDRVVKTYCASAFGFDNLDQMKSDLLLNAKRLAVNELFSEFISASSAVENFVVTSDQIRSSTVGFVRIEGDIEYRNGANLGEICVTIVAYATEEDRELLVPVLLNKRHCVTDPKLTTNEIRDFAREEVLVQALIDFDSKLKDADREQMLRLIQRVKYLDSGFVAETETYCVTAEGTIVPIELMAFLLPADDAEDATGDQPAPEQEPASGVAVTNQEGPAADSAGSDAAPPDFSGLAVRSEDSDQSGIRVEILYADGAPKRNSWVGIYVQEKDVSGNPVLGSRIAEARTTDAGSTFFALEPGTYAVVLGDIAGYPWTAEFNHDVAANATTVLALTLSRLQIGVRDAETKGVNGRWTGVYLQEPDISGNPIKGNRIAEQRTDAKGIATYDLMPGAYAVEIGDLAGNLWGEEMNHALGSGKTTTLVVTLGRLTVGVKNAQGKPLPGRWVGIYSQKLDLENQPVKDRRILEARTDNAGLVTWDLTAGEYAVEIGDIMGDLWGQELGYKVNAGERAAVVLTLGQLVVGLKDANNKPLADRWVGIYYQDADVAGNPVKGGRFADGRTGDTGLLAWDLTAGVYVLDIEEVGTLYDVEILSGAVTRTDGTAVVVEKE